MSDDSIQAILAALARLEAGQGGLQGDIFRATLELRDELIQVRTAIMARMEGHANELSAIRDSITTNYGASDHSVRLNSNTREEVQSLTKMLLDMRREFARLQTDIRELKGPL